MSTGTITKELVYKGSTRDLWRVEPGVLDFEFRDTFSVFDVGVHHQQIPGKAAALCACARQSFEVARRLGIETHFIKQVDNVTLRVKEFGVLPPSMTNFLTAGYILPLELIDRSVVAGSLRRGFVDGKMKPVDYGFTTDEVPAEGTWLPWPVMQYTTKREDIDRPLRDWEARELARITEEEETRIWQIIQRLNGGLSLVAAMAGYTRFDGKKEVGMGASRRITMLDTFGTLEEDRYVLTEALHKGRIVHYSKEIIREMFIANGYHKQLTIARASGREDPPYPDLTTEQIATVKERYERFAEAYLWVNLGRAVFSH